MSLRQKAIDVLDAILELHEGGDLTTRMRAGMATASRRIASVLVCSCMLRCVQCVCAQNGAKSNVRSMLWLLVRCVRVRWAARDLRVASRAHAKTRPSAQHEQPSQSAFPPGLAPLQQQQQSNQANVQVDVVWALTSP